MCTRLFRLHLMGYIYKGVPPPLNLAVERQSGISQLLKYLSADMVSQQGELQAGKVVQLMVINLPARAQRIST